MHKSTVASKGKGIRILIVDDEEFLANMWKLSLERRGYSVAALTDSLTALEVFRKDPAAFDIVITDQTMPGMTGGAFTAEIMKIRSDIPVVICTGYSELINRELAQRIGAKEYLTKPFDINQLENVIKKLVSLQKD